MPLPPHQTLHITVCDSLAAFDVAVFDGLEPSALRAAVAARACVPEGGFYLTASTDRTATVVPLSAALGGVSLVLHRAPPASHAEAARRSPKEDDAAESLLSDRSDSPGQPSRAKSTPALTRASSSIDPLRTPLLGNESATPAGGAASDRWRVVRQAGLFGGRRVENQLEGLERLSRLTTDLANERTLLAWVRTCLAAIRTLFTYIGLTAAAGAWHAGLTATEGAMAVLVVATAALGAWRYFRIKEVLGQKLPPREFGRISLRPLIATLLLAAAGTAGGVWSQAWEHAAANHAP